MVRTRDLCGKLIDDLIEYDMEMSKFMNKVNRDVMKSMEREEDSLIEYLINQGIQSGSIGEALKGEVIWVSLKTMVVTILMVFLTWIVRLQ